MRYTREELIKGLKEGNITLENNKSYESINMIQYLCKEAFPKDKLLSGSEKYYKKDKTKGYWTTCNYDYETIGTVIKAWEIELVEVGTNYEIY